MQIHEIKRDPTLKIPLYPVHGNLRSDIEYPTKAKFGLLDRLIHPLVLVDTPSEIPLGFFTRHAGVIWVSGLDLESNVGRYHRGVVAEGFDK